MTNSLAFVPNVSTLVWFVWTPQLELSWDYIKSNESKEIMTSINETSEIPILETLESLLTNVEFVIEDSTINNNQSYCCRFHNRCYWKQSYCYFHSYTIHNRCLKRQWWIFTLIFCQRWLRLNHHRMSSAFCRKHVERKVSSPEFPWLRVVAVRECGLDNSYKNSVPKIVQIHAFNNLWQFLMPYIMKIFYIT